MWLYRAEISRGRCGSPAPVEAGRALQERGLGAGLQLGPDPACTVGRCSGLPGDLAAPVTTKHARVLLLWTRRRGLRPAPLTERPARPRPA